MSPSRVDDAEEMVRTLIGEQRKLGVLKLPTEKDLSAKLGVSRSTLRTALERLDAEGEIARRRRVGTVITTPRADDDHPPHALAYPVDVILSLSEYLLAVGVNYEVSSVVVRRATAGAALTDTFGLAEDDTVFTATRLYEVEGVPAAYLEHILPTVIEGQEIHIESLTEGITTFLQDTEHIHITRSQSTITAEAASAEISRELNVTEGSPLLVMRVEIYAAEHPPAALGRLIFRPDILCLSASASDNTTEGTNNGLGVITASRGAQRQ